MEKKNFHFSYGLVAGIIMVLMAAAFFVFHVEQNSPIQYIMYLPFAVGVIMACMNYGKAMDNYVTFGQVFALGFKTTALITIFMLGWMVLSFFIFPEMKDEYVQASILAMEKQDLPESQIDEGVKMMQKFYYPMMIGATIFGNMVTGLIFSLIGAGVTKKKGKMPEHMQVEK